MIRKKITPSEIVTFWRMIARARWLSTNASTVSILFVHQNYVGLFEGGIRSARAHADETSARPSLRASLIPSPTIATFFPDAQW